MTCIGVAVWRTVAVAVTVAGGQNPLENRNSALTTSGLCLLATLLYCGLHMWLDPVETVSTRMKQSVNNKLCLPDASVSASVADFLFVWTLCR